MYLCSRIMWDNIYQVLLLYPSRFWVVEIQWVKMDKISLLSGLPVNRASQRRKTVMPREILMDDDEDKVMRVECLDCLLQIWWSGIGPFKSWFQNAKELAMHESGGDGPRWREQLMLRPKGKGCSVTSEKHQKGQCGQRSCERWAPRSRQGPHHPGPGRGCIWLHVKTPTTGTASTRGLFSTQQNSLEAGSTALQRHHRTSKSRFLSSSCSATFSIRLSCLWLPRGCDTIALPSTSCLNSRRCEQWSHQE